MKIYIDGKYYDKEDAKISVYDHGLLYGDGVFEGIRIYDKKVFRLREHVERLYASAKAIMLTIPMTKQEMIDAVESTVKSNDKINGYIRLIVTRGPGNLGLNPFQCPKSCIIIIVDDIQLYPEEYYREGIAVVTSSMRRNSTDSLDPRIKSLNYLNNILAKIEAINAGCLEAVILNHDGMIAECTGDNIFIIHDGKMLTPRSSDGALDGITKMTVMELAGETGITCIETSVALYDLYNADECFLTGTGAELIPVVKADDRVIGDGKPGPLFRELSAAFKDKVS